MKTHTQWNFERYRPYLHDTDSIYICRIVPAETAVTLYWKGADHGKVYYRPKGSLIEWMCAESTENFLTISDLEQGRDYEFFVENGTEKSAVGFARPGFAPGTVINYLHPDDPKYAFSGQHLCTPCILRHPDGYLLVSMDLFEGRAPQNLTLIFRSDDNGETWYHFSELFPCFWGTLFMHKGEVWMLSTSTEYGDLLIGRSTDGGKTFGTPTVLFRGACHSANLGWHKSSMPVIEHGGRIWCGVDYGAHAAGGHASCLLSADADSDLLDAGNWCVTDPLRYDPTWRGAVKGDSRGFLEGNAVVLPDGGVGNILRYTTDRGEPRFGRIPILRCNMQDPNASLSLERFVDFPGNLSKFDVRRDPKTGKYYAIVSRIVDPNRPGTRNVLSLASSTDLTDWKVVCDLLNYAHKDCKYVGFQYISFIFDGDDILYVSRTAINGAQSYHDNNYVTFHKIPNFREMIPG